DITWPGCFDGAAGCVEGADSGRTLRMRYLSSQFPTANACRDGEYRLTVDGILERSDVSCGATEAFVALAPDIVDFQATVHCSNGIDLTDFPSSQCPPVSSYGRSATVTLIGQSRAPG